MPRRINIELEYNQKVKVIEAKKIAELATLEKKYEGLLLKAAAWKSKEEAIQAERKSRKNPSSDAPRDEDTEDEPEDARVSSSEPEDDEPLGEQVQEMLVEAEDLDGDKKQHEEDKKRFEKFNKMNECLKSNGKGRMSCLINGEPANWVTRFIKSSKKFDGLDYEVKNQEVVLVKPAVKAVHETPTIPRASYYAPSAEPPPEYPQILSNTKLKKAVKIAGK
jgi:hypothetical protein